MDRLSDAAIDYVLERLEEEIEKRFEELNSNGEETRKRKVVLETEIRNLSRAIASGPEDVPSLRAAIVEREKEIADLVTRTTGRKKGSVHAQIKDLRKFVREGVGDIRALLVGKHANPAIIRQELAHHIGSITLLPDGKGEEIRYKGNWKVSGCRDGAEGAVRSLPPNLPELTILFEGTFRNAA